MKCYQTWIHRLYLETTEFIWARSSLEARTIKVAKHPGCEAMDVIARWITGRGQ